MAKLEQALILDPPTELVFQAPYNDTSTSYLKLTNPTDRLIFFKLKTTAPKTYCVRPNSGNIKPKQTISVAVMLQRMNFDGGEKNKHKFMVQSVFAPGDDASSATFDEIWRDTPLENFMNSKLKCVFVDKSDSKPPNREGVAKEVKPEKSSTSEVPAEVHSSPQKDGRSELDKLLNENKQLASLLAELRQENSQLKEESLRSRVTRSAGGMGESQSQFHPGRVSSRHPGQESSIGDMLNAKNLMIMFIVLVIGIYLGVTVF